MRKISLRTPSLHASFSALAVIFLCLFNTPTLAAPSSQAIRQHALAQVKLLTELLRDDHAVGYPEATKIQTVHFKQGDSLVLAVFTIEGFGGGNNHTQYLAAFEVYANKNPTAPHLKLIDVIPVAGKAWRAVHELQAKVSRKPQDGLTTIKLDAMENTEGDSTNAPSKPATLHFLIKQGQLFEIQRNTPPPPVN